MLDTHYAMIGIAAGIADYPLYYDATNEKGRMIKKNKKKRKNGNKMKKTASVQTENVYCRSFSISNFYSLLIQLL
ncbi:hypothetical protein EfmAA290_19260 [Enterococcus faecium]|nr:hypothetical protein EfmAA290_19260 [Enterococcus faecium]